jgi:hypothetical protein
MKKGSHIKKGSPMIIFGAKESDTVAQNSKEFDAASAADPSERQLKIAKQRPAHYSMTNFWRKKRAATKESHLKSWRRGQVDRRIKQLIDFSQTVGYDIQITIKNPDTNEVTTPNKIWEDIFQRKKSSNSETRAINAIRHILHQGIDPFSIKDWSLERRIGVGSISYITSLMTEYNDRFSYSI